MANSSQLDGLTLPGFNYLGPANPLNNGEPKNAVDRVAKEHDIRYQEILDSFKLHRNKFTVFDQVQEADRIFLDSLKDVKPKSWCECLGKRVGYLMISVKMRVEKCFRTTFYPRCN